MYDKSLDGDGCGKNALDQPRLALIFLSFLLPDLP